MSRIRERVSMGARLLLLLAAALCASALPPALAADRRDPKAVEVADAVARAIAPDGAWQKIAGLRFTFTVVRDGKPDRAFDHLWDTRAGRDRVEGEGPDKKKCVVIFDVATKTGEGWVLESAAGAARWVKQEGEAAGKLLEFGYGRFINDTYWLLMPLKLKDPGVNLDYEGRKDLAGAPHDVLKVTFNGVGLTPGDTYWVWVDPQTHLVDHWEFVLEGQTEKDRGAFDWKDWTTFGPLRLSTSKPMAGGKLAIVFQGVAALDAVPPGAFDPPK